METFDGKYKFRFKTSPWYDDMNHLIRWIKLTEPDAKDFAIEVTDEKVADSKWANSYEDLEVLEMYADKAKEHLDKGRAQSPN